MRDIEILAPAGSYEGLKAAVTASCDAVYIGGSLFGARAYANNLTEEQMMEAIDYAHVHNKALYLTVNTLLKEEELKNQLYQYMVKFYEQGLDAAIVQDYGVLHFLHANFPDLPLHASTQMTLTGAAGANVLKDYGVTRLVTSRELSLEEIRTIRENTDLEIESFVHGALCYCYSGQCLMSSMIGGRSGNRGRCAQPCRMPYDLYIGGEKLTKGKENYLLSPKDMCTLSIIPDLVECGIDSFKIEGRMKRPEYTALAAHLYRKYVDLYQKFGKKEYQSYIERHMDELERDQKDLMDLYNRGNFTKGYYVNHNGKDMMSLTRPNHSGVLVGEVVNIKGNNAGIQLIEDVHAQDLLEIRKSNTIAKARESYEFTLKDGASRGSVIRTNFFAKSPIFVGQQVYRIKNQQLLDSIQENYMEKQRKEPIRARFLARKDEPMRLLFAYTDRKKSYEIMVEGEIPMVAQKQSATKDQVIKQLSKLNTTSFCITSFEIDLEDGLFIPNGQLNELRREAVQTLTEKVWGAYRREKQNNKIQFAEINVQNRKQRKENSYGMPGICVHLEDTRLLGAVLAYDEIEAVYLNCDEISKSEFIRSAQMIHNKNILCYLVLPAIFREETKDKFKDYFTEDLIEKIDGVIIKNLEELAYMKQIQEKVKFTRSFDLVLDSNLYTLNEESKAFFHEQGVTHFTSSLELTYKELSELDLSESDMIVYGHITLMVSAQCLRNSTIGCVKHTQGLRKQEQENPYYEMRDTKQNRFYVRRHCRYCYNTIYNGSALYLLSQMEEIKKLKPKRVRIDFTMETAEQVREILSLCIKQNSDGKSNNRKSIDNEKNREGSFTKGHFNRGIE
ncbi:U32 family peptidase [Anaerosporobacter faecicola]|uniref:U32 family peptidase n=1 Tax=Anaerosporobacter faecicola TaxID=2718714 RepID=UPI00143B0083|nr:U32 family peptidase [Anaerosporobacter faecicola]